MKVIYLPECAGRDRGIVAGMDQIFPSRNKITHRTPVIFWALEAVTLQIGKKRRVRCLCDRLDCGNSHGLPKRTDDVQELFRSRHFQEVTEPFPCTHIASKGS